MARTVATAGRTVLVSGVTVAVALASLMLFPETFLRSMGYGGVATVVDGHAGRADRAARAARRPRPAGQRAADPPLRAAPHPRPRPAAAGTGWRTASCAGRWSTRCRSWSLLLALGAPFLRVSWGGTDASALPVQRRTAGGHRGAEPRLPRQPDRPDRGPRQVPRRRRRLAGPHRAALAAYASRLGRRPRHHAARA